MSVVYQHKRGDTGEVFYIGVGVSEKRAYSKTGRNKHWYNVVNKVGYVVDILFTDLTREAANEKERELIQLYGRLDLGTGILVNMKEGGLNGEGWIMPEEVKQKISSLAKGRKLGPQSEDAKQKKRKPNPKVSLALRGRKQSLDHVENVRRGKTGKPSSRKGKPNPKVSVALTGRRRPEVSEKLKGRPKPKVECKFCASFISENMINRHESSCKLNPNKKVKSYKPKFKKNELSKSIKSKKQENN
jgi:hypothetical protein